MENIRKKIVLWISIVIGLSFALFLTYDIIFTNIFGTYYCSQEPNPKTLINKKVEYPLSIYWEDNVYPGFNAEDRKLMIMNYLDGKHLKTMALNGDDGKVYVYHLNEPLWEDIRSEFSEKELYTKGFEKYAQTIMKNEKVYTKETMPKMNYTVTFDEVKLNAFARKFLYSDETKIVDNNTNKTIAYNRRVMRFFYNALPDIALGDRYYWQEPVCGNFSERFEKTILQGKGPYSGTRNHKIDVNERLYKKYIKGEK